MREARRRLPPGRQPYDPLNGFRVGGYVGAVVGALVAVAISLTYLWLALVGAALGGAVGYWWEKRSLRRAAADLEDGSPR